jgi:hypothetical protein
MSLGCRIVRGSRVSAFARPTSSPREPLLFLYPPGIRNSSAAARRPTPSITPTNLDNAPSDYILKRGSEKERWAETGSEIRPDFETEREQIPSNDIDHILDIPNAEDDDKPTVSRRKSTAKSPTENAFEPEPVARRRVSARRCLTTRRYRLPQRTKLLVRRLIQITQRVSEHEAHKRSVRRAYEESRREDTESWSPDWRVVLSTLDTHTLKTDKWLDKALNIIVSEDAVEILFYGVDTNMWDIGDRYGCLITLDSRDGKTGKHQSYFLSGSAAAIRNTALDILKVLPTVKLSSGLKSFDSASDKAIETSSDSESRSLDPANDRVIETSSENESRTPEGKPLRNVVTAIERQMQSMRADEIPRPETWTRRSFVDFVKDLTSIKITNHLQRMLYRGLESHTSTVLNVLREIFEDPDCRSSISREAFNMAIAFFIKTNQIPDVRRFFRKMKLMNVQPDVETFNIMLQGAAKSGDLRNFNFSLHLMLRRGVCPNGKTWIAFMMAIPDVRVKLYILSAMREKGLLHQPSIMRAVCQHIVPYEINGSLDNGESLDEFLRHMDSRYGARWLTLEGANQILHALGARGLVSRSWEFLRIMDSRFVNPDIVSIDTILHHCRNSLNVEGGIQIMKDLPPSIPSALGEEIYSTLFDMAWRTKSYNFAKVVWKYACLNARTTGVMRIRVRKRLRAAVLDQKDDTNSRQRWKMQAGLFIIGSPTVGTPVAAYPFNPLRQLLKTVDKRLEEEYSAFEDWVPKEPFADMLLEAWKRDKAWKGIVSPKELNDSQTLSWKLKRAITIPVKRREVEGCIS